MVASGAICGPPPSVHRVIKTDREPERWCFGCRKRRAGTHELVGLDPEWVHRTAAYVWAEPHWRYRCDGCGKDRRLGFGQTWEYDE